MHRLLIPALAIVASCYRPRAEGACVVTCDQASAPQCPNGLSCGADGLCYDDVECDELGGDGGVVDMRPDETVISDDCVSTLLLGVVCPSSFGTAEVYATDGDILTDSNACSEVLNTAGAEVCLIAAENITIAAEMRIRGTRPLALFARQQLVIDATAVLDVARGGAAAGECGTAKGRNVSVVGEAAGGGAGGTFVRAGGHGGIPTGFAAAQAQPASMITTLRGGCAGGAGGNNSGGGGGGRGGSAGGAIQLMAADLVVIQGAIDAFGEGGGGGGGGGTAAGGGGGGSGGLIAVDAKRITITPTAILRAHGGGGGGGAAGVTNGGNGNSATPTDGSPASGGGGGSANSGAGGAGSSDTSSNGSPGGSTSSNGAGSGGGGGGAGAIVLRSAEPLDVSATANIHPPAGPVP